MNAVEISFIKNLFEMQNDVAEDSIKALQKQNKHLYIFGAGVAGKLIKQTLERNNITVFGFVDNAAVRVGTTLEGVPVVPFSTMADDKNKTVVIGSVAYHHEMIDQCLSGGVLEEDICFADFLHYEGRTEVLDYFKANIDAIVQIYQHCADQDSRELFMANLLYQLNRDRRHYHGKLSPLSRQYFEADILPALDEEVYFDCGAKDGDTVLAFHAQRQGKYKKVLAFEPDGANFEVLQRNTNMLRQVVNVNKGVGESAQTLSFKGNIGGHSAFAPEGDLKAEIVPLDQFAEEKPTLIKMDIEGFELSALKGAGHCIKNFKPRMAICLYHKPKDIVELPKYVLSQREDYTLHLRLYRDFGHDLVCYFV